MDINKVRADLVKQINYLFQDPTKPQEYREFAVEELTRAVQALSSWKQTVKSKK